MFNKKEFIRNNRNLLSAVYRKLMHNRFKIRNGNQFVCKGAFLSRCKVTINGTGNKVLIDPGLTRLYNCDITVRGSDCEIVVGADSNLHETSLYIEDDGGKISVGRHVTITGKTHIAVIEGATVSIGDDCLFSDNIQIRVGDSHSILDATTGKRINPSKDVTIGNHVWIGNTVSILKGAVISDNSVVGAHSVVTGKSFPSNCVIGGFPAKVLKESVTWDPHRLPAG